jgi:TolB protein
MIIACATEPTNPAAIANPPEGASLAKGGKTAPAPIAVSLNGADGQNIFLIDTTSRLQQVTRGGLDDSPTWSPDRRKIAFVRGDGPGRQIYVKSLSGGRETLVGPGQEPSWSPDGNQIAFTSIVGGNADVYVMNIDGSDVRRLTTDPAFDGEPHWSPDGLSIAFMSTRTGTGEIFVMKPDGGAQMRRTFCGPSYYCVSPQLSPIVGDFRLAFYQGTYSSSGATPVSAIRVMDSNGTVVWGLDGALVTGSPTWSPDAQYIAFVGQGGQATPVIYTASVNGTDLHWIPQTVGSAAGSPAWTR